MKLLKIGRSSSCDIVLPSENVSALHAELLIMDNGEIFIEDKNSTNGTMVGNKRILPNSEVPVRRGDYIVLADMELPWNRVPQPENIAGFKQIVNIGTNFRNDIILDGAYGSRFHANLKISKNGKKAYIKDLNSKNGVKVNGAKIKQGKDIEIKRNDVVVCGDTDITEQIRPYMPKPFPWLKLSMSATCLVAIYVVLKLIIGPDVPTDFRPATVYVYTKYCYTAKVEDNPFPKEIWDGVIPLPVINEKKYVVGASGTAFFIDRDGYMGTNRHVAMPWEYREDNINNDIRNDIENYLDQKLANIDVIKDRDDYIRFLQTEWGVVIDQLTESVSEMNAMIARIRKSPITISGEVISRYIGYPGRNYTVPELEMQRCDLVAESGTKEKDIAILQLNDKKTPEDIKHIFDIKHFRTDKLVPTKERLFTIGYPLGLVWGIDQGTRSLEPDIRDLRCSKIPGRYDFELQGEAVGGASGSPIFDKKGYLVGILWGGIEKSSYAVACQAKWLKELYEKEVGY